MKGRAAHDRLLPETVSVFPLTGALLLPGGRLPLNIFEQRYLNMIDDSLATNDRLIGMIQPTEQESSALITPPLFGTGCAGRIIAFAEEGDRYLVTLEGVRRFDIISEKTTERLYRRAVVSWSAYQHDLIQDDAKIDRRRLIAGVRAYFTQREIAVDWNVVDAVPDGKLVTTIAMVCPFEPTEKQALLQAVGLEERAKVLIGLVESALRPNGDTVRH